MARALAKPTHAHATRRVANRPETGAFRLHPYVDVVVVAALAMFATAAAVFLPDGSGLRFLLALPIIVLAPGYLLIQSILVPARPAGARVMHALFSLGLSPAIVGLLALMTAIVPGGFQPATIILVVAMFCIVTAAITLVRRWTMPSAPPTEPTAAPAATTKQAQPASTRRLA